MLRVSGEDKLSRSFLSPKIIFSSDSLEKEDLRNKADGLFAQHGVHPSCFSPRRGERLVCVTGWRPGSISWTRFSRIWSFDEHEFDGVRRQDNVKNETFESSRAILEQKGYFEQGRDGYIKKGSDVGAPRGTIRRYICCLFGGNTAGVQGGHEECQKRLNFLWQSGQNGPT